MTIEQQFAKCLNISTSPLTEVDQLELYRLSYTEVQLSLPDIETFSSFLDSLDSKPEITISSNLSEETNIPLSEGITESINYLKDIIDNKEEDESFTIQLTLRKNLREGKIFVIYNEYAFTLYLANIGVKGCFYFLETLIQNDIFEIVSSSSQTSFATKTFGYNSTVREKIDRKERFDKIKSISHSSLSSYSLLPEDFSISDNIENNPLASHFALAEFLLIISSIWDITTFDLDQELVETRLNGYKSINATYKFSDIELSHIHELRKIYFWVFDGGNVVDKIGLARNVISLHLSDSDAFSLTGNVFLSIKSGYEIYLKENINQYIEIRNKINDQLLEVTKSSSDIVSKFTSDFQKSIFSFVSFFISVVVLRYLSKSDFDNIMGYDATMISFGFLVLGVIFLIYSSIELNQKRNRFSENYGLLKNRFSDILLSEDISRILNNDEQFMSDLDFIDKSRKSYTLAWISLFCIFFLIILLTSDLFPLKDWIVNLLDSSTVISSHNVN